MTVGRRSQQVLFLTASPALVGLVVAGFEVLTADVLLEAVADGPTWWHAAAPALGLLAAACCLRARISDTTFALL